MIALAFGGLLGMTLSSCTSGKSADRAPSTTTSGSVGVGSSTTAPVTAVAVWEIDKVHPPTKKAATFKAPVTRLGCSGGETGEVLKKLTGQDPKDMDGFLESVQHKDNMDLLLKMRTNNFLNTLRTGIDNAQMNEALQKVKQLQGLLPIFGYCKRIRDDQNYWQQVEAYITAHSEARFSHAICPACYEEVVQPQLDALQKTRCHC